jgi:hypothetical protein
MLTSQRRRTTRWARGEARERRGCCCAGVMQKTEPRLRRPRRGTHAGRAGRERETTPGAHTRAMLGHWPGHAMAGPTAPTTGSGSHRRAREGSAAVLGPSRAGPGTMADDDSLLKNVENGMRSTIRRIWDMGRKRGGWGTRIGQQNDRTREFHGPSTMASEWRSRLRVTRDLEVTNPKSESTRRCRRTWGSWPRNQLDEDGASSTNFGKRRHWRNQLVSWPTGCSREF